MNSNQSNNSNSDQYNQRVIDRFTQYSSERLAKWIESKSVQPVQHSPRCLVDLPIGSIVRYNDGTYDCKAVILDTYHTKYCPMVNIVWLDNHEYESFHGYVEMVKDWSIVTEP